MESIIPWEDFPDVAESAWFGLCAVRRRKDNKKHPFRPSEKRGNTMKFKIGVLAAAFAGLLTALPAQAETLRVGMECTYQPFNYRTPDGQMAGYDVDVAQAIATRIGVDLEYVCQDWDGIIPALLANKFDLIIASLSITEERREKIDFSIPYRTSQGRLIAPKELQLKLFDDNGQPILDAFKGVRFGVERATIYDSWVKANLPEADLVYYDGNQSLFMDLAAGRIDLAITNPMKAYLDFLSKEDGAGFEFVSPPLTDVKIFGDGVGVGLRKGNEELLARIDKALAEIIAEGKLEEFSLKYFPFSIAPDSFKGVGQ